MDLNAPDSLPESGQQPQEQTNPARQFLIDSIGSPLTWVYGAFDWGNGDLKPKDDDLEPGPDLWQIAILLLIERKHLTISEALQIAVSSGHGIGKAQPKAMLLHTPDGLKRWGDLKVGDCVFGRNGLPTRIKAVHDRGTLPVYRVTFDDGSATLACGDHLWTVRGRQQRRTKAGWLTLSTNQLIERGVKRRNGIAQARQWELPSHSAVEFNNPKTLPVHPYTLGVWLGDGGRKTSRITANDPEVISRLRDVGETVTKGAKLAWCVIGLRQKLRPLGILDSYSYQKSVPTMYLEASALDRAELLRGLLDTDGECTLNGSIVFSSTSRALAEDVVWLARSLGGKAKFQPTVKKPKYRGPDGFLLDGKPCWRVTLQMPSGFKSFYISRKQQRVRNVEPRYLARWIEAIEPAGDTDCMCITVEAPDNLYLTNDFIVTHNSALIAWIILWFISTRANCNGIVTANTGKQLNGKTWREVGVWLQRIKPSILEECPLTMTATKLYHSNHERTWFINAIEWSEKNPEAFAGLHADHVLVLFDEGSAIPQVIWDTTSGAMTTAGAMWIVFGNPTRNTGAFFECFHKFRHRWITHQIDSRTAKKTNKKQIANWVADHGEDSDFVRVRVRGVFPRSGSTQFISTDLVAQAQARYREVGVIKRGHRHELCFGPILLGIDVARFGDDASTIWLRHGRYARRLARYIGLDTTQLTGFIIEHIDEWEPDTVFIDGTGLGAGVVDQVRNRGYKVAEVIGSAKPQDERTYKNLRAEMWGKLKEWLATGAVEDLTDMRDDLTGPEYFYDNHQAIQLESKDDMKGRGLASPDNADALAQTFAYKVTARSAEDARRKDYGSGKRNQGSAWTA